MVKHEKVPVPLESSSNHPAKMFMDKEAVIHFAGGAAGGTTASAITCPLEVIKTRMQSTKGITLNGSGPSTSQGPTLLQQAQTSQNKEVKKRPTIFRYFSHIVKTEGIGALYKGLGPNLLGVAASKAVYFYAYSSGKRFWNVSDVLPPNSAAVHVVSSASAAFVDATVINPVWMVKTRLQLSEEKTSVAHVIRRIYNREGIRGFYKGVTASYAGISETVIQFVIYEQLRSLLMRYVKDENDRSTMDYIKFMCAGGTAKFCSCLITYPHEVVRTRLREESHEKHGFFRTLYQLSKDGYPAMYRGLSVQLLRTVPNTAITMSTYELVVYGLHQL